MRVMLLCSSFNGLSQRVWLDLRAAGHDVRVELSSDMDAVRAAALAFDPTLIVCPFLRERVPDDLWMRYRTIIIHPGPIGDRGPSSLDWAITEGATTWGVTALQAVRELDDDPVWATRTFPIRIAAPRKGSLYNGPVSAAAVDLVREVVAKATRFDLCAPSRRGLCVRAARARATRDPPGRPWLRLVRSDDRYRPTNPGCGRFAGRAHDIVWTSRLRVRRAAGAS